MKKIISSMVFAMIFAVGQVYAACDTSVCPKPPYPVSSGVPMFFSTVTGAKFAISKTAEVAMEKLIEKTYGAKFDVTIVPYGAIDLKNGKFRKITAQANNVMINGWSMSSVKSESVCDYNYIVIKNDNVYSGENFLSEFEIVVTDNDLQKMFNSSQYRQMLESMNLSMNNFVLFKVFDPIATIKDNRLELSLKVVSPLIHAGNVRRISMSMGLCVENGEIKFSDICFNEKSSNINLKAILPVLNKINPFVYRTNLLMSKDSMVKVSDINIVNNKIIINGNVFIPKSYF